jgi:predicted transcriptional regulator
VNFASIISQIEEQGKTKQMIETLIPMFDVLPKELKTHAYKQLQCIAYTFSLEEANKIVLHMSPYGQHWTYEQIVEFVKTKNVDPNQYIHYYLVMNMTYNDYYQTAEIFGLKNNTDFFYWLSKNFIEDPDATEFKVEKYFKM